jgi:hypothetical protein
VLENFNPFLEVNDPFAKQRQIIQKHQEEVIEFQRLCFEIFHMSDMGKKLYDMMLKKYIIPSRFVPTDPQASNQALYWEGFKEGMRGLWDQGLMHQKRINEGNQR